MAQRIIVYWRDIPAQVIVRERRTVARRQLPPRFMQAIDACAMRVGARDSDAYLAQWRKGAPETVSDALDAESERACARIEAEYPRERLARLVGNAGYDTPNAA
ncbi:MULTISPECIES: virulence factor [unclassified Roseitalea]|uniref:virulence factor n=1 Tax=unclassified Roseitalea TaxID=2639107 RepID=UPI00273E0FB5|nr:MULTISPECIES: virulence factor [unclassified Roseitalea]